jgi:putative nucleotidyltransferase with HDIG domain
MNQRALPVGLADLLKRDIRLPVCPIIFVRLMQTLEHPNAALRDLSEILSSDPHLATQVLRVANSALYSHSKQVRSTNEAILRIGFSEVWAVASAVKAKELFHTASGEWSQLSTFLWEHALATAMLAKHIAKKCGMHQEGENTFTAGLLHDLGKSVLHQVEPQYALLCQNGALFGNKLTLLETDFFGTHHARFGGELLRHWSLPDTLASLVEGHHDEIDPADALKPSRVVLDLANQTAHALAPAPGERHVIEPQVPEHLLAELKLELDPFLDAVDDAQKDLATIKQF